MTERKLLYLFIASIFFVQAHSMRQATYAIDKSLGQALNLYTEKDYTRAKGLYQSVLRETESGSQKDQARLGLGLIYTAEKNFAKASEYILPLTSDASQVSDLLSYARTFGFDPENIAQLFINIADSYQIGDGVPKDPLQAVEIWRAVAQSASAGDKAKEAEERLRVYDTTWHASAAASRPGIAREEHKAPATTAVPASVATAAAPVVAEVAAPKREPLPYFTVDVPENLPRAGAAGAVSQEPATHMRGFPITGEVSELVE